MKKTFTKIKTYEDVLKAKNESPQFAAFVNNLVLDAQKKSIEEQKKELEHYDVIYSPSYKECVEAEIKKGTLEGFFN